MAMGRRRGLALAAGALCLAFSAGGAAADAKGVRISLLPPGECAKDFDYSQVPRDSGPEKGVFGLPMGASLAEARDRLGPANGLARLGSGRTALFYGQSLILVFKDGELARAGSERHGPLAQLKGDPHPFFDDVDWSFGPGLKPGMPFAEVVERLGRPEAERDYRVRYVADNGVRVTLKFVSSRINDSDPTFELNGFWMVGSGARGPVQPFAVTVPGG
jgi:hypothetical protein